MSEKVAGIEYNALKTHVQRGVTSLLNCFNFCTYWALVESSELYFCNVLSPNTLQTCPSICFIRAGSFRQQFEQASQNLVHTDIQPWHSQVSHQAGIPSACPRSSFFLWTSSQWGEPQLGDMLNRFLNHLSFFSFFRKGPAALL